MEQEDNGKRLPIWEDPDIDLERGKRNGEKWAKAGAEATDEEMRDYYWKTKAIFDAVIWPKRSNELKGINHAAAEAEA